MNITDPLLLPNGQTMPNRIAKAAMTEGLADRAGRATPELATLYGRWAAGGAGMQITGNIHIDRNHLERAGNVVIDDRLDAAGQAGLAAMAKAARSHGALVWAQVSHAGRQTPGNINPRPLAPSAVTVEIAKQMGLGEPRAMKADDIAAVADRFVNAAMVLAEAGFDGMQLHAAHGYLLSSFLSPLANRRQDDWGGTLENRARLLLDIVRRIKASAPQSFGLAVKLNSADFQRGGFAEDESATVASWLDQAGIDFLEISGGSYEAPAMAGLAQTAPAGSSTARREAYFLSFAPRIRASLSRAKLMVTGGFRTRAAMDAALSDDGVDIIGVGRPFCVDPGAAAPLLNGRVPALPKAEHLLRLGPGWLSPASPFNIVRQANVGFAQMWCCEQIVRLGDGLDPAPPGGLLKAARAYRKRDAAKAAALER